eukprot:12054443-Ditylum_brightwellii.AAC.1
MMLRTQLHYSQVDRNSTKKFRLQDQILSMSAMLTLQKDFKTGDADVGIGFDPLVIPFIPKPSTLKTENS